MTTQNPRIQINYQMIENVQIPNYDFGSNPKKYGDSMAVCVVQRHLSDIGLVNSINKNPVIVGNGENNFLRLTNYGCMGCISLAQDETEVVIPNTFQKYIGYFVVSFNFDRANIKLAMIGTIIGFTTDPGQVNNFTSLQGVDKFDEAMKLLDSNIAVTA
jgi:hypothetical protein